MDKLQKFLAKQPRPIRRKLVAILDALSAGQIDGLDMLPLKGSPGHFRVRTGKIRILCYRYRGIFLAYNIDARDSV